MMNQLIAVYGLDILLPSSAAEWRGHSRGANNHVVESHSKGEGGGVQERLALSIL